jgi:Kdo2-lipid IVA lauroyltransferase/acyltransferase
LLKNSTLLIMIAVFFTRLGVGLFSLLPFRFIYLLSDVICFFLEKIIQYRKKVMWQNLKNSYPDKTDAALRLILHDAYRNLCDVLVEGIKGLSMSEQDFRERYLIKNPEITFTAADSGKSIILTGGHYANWEYGVVSWAIWFRHKTIGIYKPLTNKSVEQYLNKKRSALGMHLAATYETRKVMEAHQKIPSMYVLMGDQSPSNMKTTHWLTFLRQDTAWLHGVGSIAHHSDFPIYYLDTQRVARGFYESKLLLLVENPSDFSPEAISEIYARQLEKIIDQKPADWLWSHKRWKHKR